MAHYFDSDPSQAGKDQRIVDEIFFQRSYSFLTDAGVFSKRRVDYGSRLLIETLKLENAKTILDLGCGYGPIGVVIASHYPDVHVTMVDINPRAIELAKENAKRNNVENRTSIYVSDGYSAISHCSFDCVLFNPPIRAGKSVIYPLFAKTREHLNPGGRLLVVIRKHQGAKSAQKELIRSYSQVEVLAQKKGYWVLQATMI